MKFWNEQGQENIFRRKRELDQFLIQETKKTLGFFHCASEDSRLRGPLQAFLLPEQFAQIEFTKLIKDLFMQTQAQVAITFVDGEMYLRMSPHVYNTEEQISEALRRLRQFFAVSV